MLLFLESIGVGEIMLIFFFILIFFGADSIPGIARKLGRGIRQVKDAAQDIQNEITKVTYDMRKEMNENEAVKDFKKALNEPSEEIARNLNKEGGEISKQLNQTIKFDKHKSTSSSNDHLENGEKKPLNANEETNSSQTNISSKNKPSEEVTKQS